MLTTPVTYSSPPVEMTVTLGLSDMVTFPVSELTQGR